ncbi:MAG: hypothetical protein U1F26_03330 [Lysobacterales bacterium]
MKLSRGSGFHILGEQREQAAREESGHGFRIEPSALQRAGQFGQIAGDGAE